MTTIIFKHGKASVRLVHVEKNIYALSNLWSKTRGEGHAQVAVQKLVDYADKHGYTVLLLVQRYGHPNLGGLDNKELEAFYTRFDFVRKGGTKPLMMRRCPRN